jgi:hypothetical protein
MKYFGQGLIVMLALVSRSAYAQPTQPIYLQYDGFVRNDDGTYTLSFGYFNMNNVDVTVQPGDANGFAPSAADRNQPVRFVKGRHRFACSMVMDENFDGKLQWTVKFAGKTSTTTAKLLDPLYELEHSSEEHATAGLDVANAPKNVCVNRGPSVRIGNPFAPPPGGPDGSMTGKVNQDVTLVSQIEDDGLPRGGALKIAWKKISGPGEVTFTDAAASSTRAKFGAPGKYEIELSATDGEKTSRTTVAVTVTAAP